MNHDQPQLDRLRRDIAYQVADLRKSQRRRLNRLRDELRYSPLPATQLNTIFATIAGLWDDAFARLENDLITQGEYLLDSGMDFATVHTELTRLATTTLNNLLDADLTPEGVALCSKRDRLLHLTTYGWNVVLFIAVTAVAVFTGLAALSVTVGVAIVAVGVLVRVLLGRISAQRNSLRSSRAMSLSDHLHAITTQSCAELDHLPDALAHVFEQQGAI